jgi:ubiquinone/menaquinone biosynthesis C-methylase UbiE
VRECGNTVPITILDCACGIGTQARGLAKVGFRVTGTDFSPRAIERARAEALERGLDLRLYVADMLYLNAVPETGFDAVISPYRTFYATRTSLRPQRRSGKSFETAELLWPLIKECPRPTARG